MQLAGIDIGTTTISGVVFEIREGQERVRYAKTFPNGSDLPPGFSQERIQDAQLLAERARGLLDELLEEYPLIEGIGLTGQMHGIVYVDQEGGVVSPLYTWQDQRGNRVEGEGQTLTQAIEKKTGLWTATGFGLVTHLYQTLHRQVPKGAAGLCTMPDYLGMCLTGRKKPLLHASMAASLGFYDGEKRCFLRECYESMGGDPSFLPEVTDRVEKLGDYRGIPVTVAIGDNQASFLGSVGEREETVLLNVGTGGQLSVVSRRYFAAEGIEARPFQEDSYLLVGSSLCGGRAYAILERFFREVLQAAQEESFEGSGEKPQEASRSVSPQSVRPQSACPQSACSRSVCSQSVGSQYEVLNRLARKGWEKEKEKEKEKRKRKAWTGALRRGGRK